MISVVNNGVASHRDSITARIIGGQIPNGRVRVSGAKNAATRLLAAALLCDGKVVLENFPTELVDANYKRDFIVNCGGHVSFDSERESASIEAHAYTDVTLSNYAYPIRTTYLLVPGLIKRGGRARVPYPGGCNIGQRGYDLHMMVWRAMGAEVIEREDHLEVLASSGFRPAEINFPISTIGGTENALLSASIVAGTTTIRNAYISPEIECLIQFLRTVGVKIEVLGNSFVRVTGCSTLIGAIFPVMPDRIEALTWIVYAALSRGNLTIEDVPKHAMDIPLTHLRDAGIDYYHNSANVRIEDGCVRYGVIQPFELSTGTHPGIISDMQPFYVLLGLHADGTSRIFDYRYPDRIKYCEELNAFYPGQLEWAPGKIKVCGRIDRLPRASQATSTDLRGSMALVMAALLADGTSEVRRAEMALRGYNKLPQKLRNLGVAIDLQRMD